MEVVRCCSRVRLPGGERRWRRMARLAGFDGTVQVRDFRQKDRDRKQGSIYLGTQWGETMTIHIKHGHGIPAKPKTYDPLSTYGHELGHYILRRRGKPTASPLTFTSTTNYGLNPIERACDRYSRLLRGKSG